MDRHGSLENAVRRRRASLVVFGLCARLLVFYAPYAHAQQPAPVPSLSPPGESIDRRPYRISLHLGIDASARIDLAKWRAGLIRDWQVLARRFIGAPWIVTIADPTSPLTNFDLDSLEPDAFASVATFDKVWVVRVARSDAGPRLSFSGREYDTATQRLGPLQVKLVPALSDAPRDMLQFTRDLFNPTATISGEEGGRALLHVQGAMIAPASPLGAVVEKGTVFQPLRLVSLPDGKVQIVWIKHTYLQVESMEGATARCAIISAWRDPLSKKVSRPYSFAAVGLKPGKSPITLRFVTKPDMAPAAGYTLTARLVPDGQPREQGTTDRAGRIVLKPGFARGLVILRLLAGSAEPVVELPIMPGERTEYPPIPFDPRLLTVALETQLDSLRDEVVDLVALRARLESRMKARLEGSDWPGLEAELKEFARLTPRDTFAERLTQLKDDAAHRQAELKTAILTKTAQAQISDLQSMIDRYLDDEAFSSYAEALKEGTVEVAAKAKKEAKKAVAPRASVPPGGANGKAKTPRAASTVTPAPGQPKQKAPGPGAQSQAPFCATMRDWHGDLFSGTVCHRLRSLRRRSGCLNPMVELRGRNAPARGRAAQEREPASAVSGSLMILDFECLPTPNTLPMTAPPRKSRRRAEVERLSIWLYQLVTILVNSSIFSSCSRVYCSAGSPSLASWTQCSRSAIVGSISRRLRSAMMTRNVSMTSLRASNRSRLSPMM